MTTEHSFFEIERDILASEEPLSVAQGFLRTLEKEAAAIEAVEIRLSGQKEVLENACRILAGRGGKDARQRVVVSGVGKAGLIAQKVAGTLNSVGISAVFLHPVEALHGDLGFVHEGDSGLFFSYSGETIELVRLAAEFQRMGCRLVSVTQNHNSSLGIASTACIEMGAVNEACQLGLAPSCSTTAMLAIGDALSLAAAQLNGFDEEAFARNHPAGALGLRFRSVTSEMRTGDRLVRVASEELLSDVVQRVSVARTGAAVLTKKDGTLSGIFTDGDLRRAIVRDADALRKDVGQFSTMPCHSIRTDQSLADALRAFGQTGAEEFPVIDETSCVVGLLCLKDISTF